MAIKETNAPVYSTVSKSQKEKLAVVAERHHRTISKEIAYIIDLYLEGFDSAGREKFSTLSQPESNLNND